MMDQATIAAVCDELRGILPGRRAGRIFTLSARKVALDLRLADQRYLFIGLEPNAPRLYLIKRRFKDLEKQASNPLPFHLLLKKHLSGLVVTSLEKVADERIVRIAFAGESESGAEARFALIIQLTGKSSNLFLLDDRDRIVASQTASDHNGQRPGEEYAAPQRPAGPLKDTAEFSTVSRGHDSISNALIDITQTARPRTDSEQKPTQRSGRSTLSLRVGRS